MTLSRRKLLAFGFSAIGVNMMKLLLGTYLCNAVLTAGFKANLANWTYAGKDVVSASVWGAVILAVKVLNGVSDFPFTGFLDHLNVKIGKRRFGVLVGFAPLILAFVLFLYPPSDGNLLLNSLWLGALLVLFYFAYSCVMLSYYASFSEITKDDRDRQFLSNAKSVADVVYNVLGFALIPVLIDFMNIRTIALCFLPLSLLILAGISMVREDGAGRAPASPRPRFFASIARTLKNREYSRWMIVFAFMTFSIQLFLSGQSVFLSGVGHFSGGQIAMINACAFGPVPLTIMLYNRVGKRRGFRFGFVYAMLAFAIAMGVCALANAEIVPDAGARMGVALLSGLICSLGIGTFFSVTYVIPSHLAAKEAAETGESKPSMYFAIQGLFGASVTGIAAGPVLVGMRNFGDLYRIERVVRDGHIAFERVRGVGLTPWIPVVVGLSLIACCALTAILPEGIASIGKSSPKAGRGPAGR